MSDPQAGNRGLDARRRRIIFRSWHRGTLETDLILGRFADAEIENLSETELDDYEFLLEAPDRDIFSWVTEEMATPHTYDTPVFRKLIAFHDELYPVRI
jgi:antitoxin CptB